MISHLYVRWGGYRFGTRPHRYAGEKSRYAVAFSRAGAEIGRPGAIFASQRRGANGIVTFLGGILT